MRSKASWRCGAAAAAISITVVSGALFASAGTEGGAALPAQGPKAATPESASGRPAEGAFAEAHARFVRGRELQKLHRNTAEAEKEFAAAFSGYRLVARKYPGDPIVPRAVYMSGSAKLFLNDYDAAIAAYGDVVRDHPEDAGYLAKALTRKAAAEKAKLDPNGARLTIAAYFARFAESAAPERAEAEKIKRSLDLIGRGATAVEAARWFGASPTAPAPAPGEVTLLYFFSTWCPNCLKEVAFIKDLDDRFRSKGLRLVGVTNHSRGQTDESVAQYAKQHGFGFPVAVDLEGKSTRAYGAGSVPTGVLIDRAGVIRWHDHPAAIADAAIERLLAEKPPARVGR